MLESSQQVPFFLFRCTTHPESHPQEDFIFDQADKKAILRDALKTTNTQLRKGSIWHIGNVKGIEPDAYYFRFGRKNTDRPGDRM